MESGWRGGVRKGWNEVCSSALASENFDSEQECATVLLEWKKRDGEPWDGVSKKRLWRQLFDLVSRAHDENENRLGTRDTLIELRHFVGRAEHTMRHDQTVVTPFIFQTWMS